MEQWQKEFIEFMNKVGEYNDIAFIIESGKKNHSLADKIMKFVEEKNINTFGMWEDKSLEKYDKYQTLFEMVLSHEMEAKK